MRILVIAPEQLPIPPITGGSVESVIYNLFQRIATTHKVTLLSRSHPDLPRMNQYIDKRLKIIRISQSKRSDYIRSVLRRVKHKRYDLIQVENRPKFVANVRKVFPRTPIVLSLHSLTFMSLLSKKEANLILKQVAGVVCVSRFLAEWMRQRFPRHADKFRACVPGVDTALFHPQPPSFKRQLREAWKVNDTFNVLFVGRIVKMKGLHTLVEAVARLKKDHPDITLIAVGASWPGSKRATSYMKEVYKRAKELDVRIVFTGYIPPTEVYKMYHLGDVFVCPTMFEEGLCMVNPEAMASGIPVIASSRGGIPEVVTDGHSGLLVPDYQNPEAFAKAIASVKTSAALAEKLSTGGRKRAVEELSWDRSAQTLLDCYEAWVQHRGKQRNEQRAANSQR